MVILLPSIGLGQAAAPVGKPPEALLQWSTTNMQAFSTAWLGTTPGKTSQSPALERYRQALARKEVGTVFYLRPWIGIDWNDLAAVDQPVTIMLVPAGKTGNDIAIWIQGKQNSIGVQTCRKAATAYWEKNRYRFSSKRSGEMEIQRFARAAKTDQPDERYLVLTTQGMLLTTRATDHRALIASFANDASDKAPDDDRLSAASATFSLKPLSLLRQRRITTRASGSRNWAISAERLGAQQLNHLEGRLWLAPQQQCPVQLELSCAIASPLKQAVRLLEMPRGEQLPPSTFATTQDDTISTWRWNCRSAMQAFGNLFDEMIEPGEFGEGLFEDLLDGLKEDPEGPLVDLRRDLFDRLGPRFRAYSQVSAPKTNQRQSIYVAECHDANAEHVQETLEKFFRGDRTVTRQSIGEYMCWSVGPGKSLFIAVESKDIAAFRAAAIGPGGFFMATDPALLQATLTNASPPEDDRALWSQLLQASEESVAGDSSARVLLHTSRRFSAALNVVYSQPPPYRSWESGLLRWALYGDDADGKLLSAKDVPTQADLQGFFLPAWLVFQHDPDRLQLKIGFLDRTTPTRPE